VEQAAERLGREGRIVDDVSAAVLIVEDDELIASSLVRALQSQGYDASSTGTVSSALDSIADSAPDLVLLDLGLPDGDGSAVATRMAVEHPRVPVIALTARSDEIDIVLGLESGAVDYIVKPFHLAELLARIRAHLRFAESARSDAGRRQVVAGDVVIDAAARRAFVGTDEIALRPKEFDLIHRLAVDAGLVVTREQLIDDVWDDNWWGSTKTLDVHVNSIRRKLGEQPGQPSRISTIRGVGYRLELECRAAAGA
jgi:DNA-binding response OmpR family regulator